MAEDIKIHLVFSENSTEIGAAVSRQGIISGKDSSLEQAAVWAEEGGGDDPDLFLINSEVFFNGKKEDDTSTRKKFLQLLTQIRKYRRMSRIVPLLAAEKGNDAELIAGLLKVGIYDFWLVDSFDELDISRFIFTRRTLNDVEEYLQTNEASGNKGNETIGNRNKEIPPSRKNQLPWRNFKKIYQPYVIKSNIIAFASHDDSLINQGAALLTALKLAEYGFKVALVETISEMPFLAGNLSIAHPFCNTRHALAMFQQNNNNFLRDCLLNKEKYRADGYAQEIDKYLDCLPPNLFFLADSLNEELLAYEAMGTSWPGFAAELTRIIMFEQNFNFLIFCCQGENVFTRVVLEELAYFKIVTLNMLPGSIAYGLKEKKRGRGQTCLIGTKKLAYLLDELNGFLEEPLLYPPASFTEDILAYIYTKKSQKISQESWTFIKQITRAIGIKEENDDYFKGTHKLTGLRNLLRFSRG